MATVTNQIPLAPQIGVWLYVGTGNPNTGLQTPDGRAAFSSGPGCIYVQQDGVGGSQLWVLEGVGNTWQLQAPSQLPPVPLTTATTLSLTQSGSVVLCDATGCECECDHDRAFGVGSVRRYV